MLQLSYTDGGRTPPLMPVRTAPAAPRPVRHEDDAQRMSSQSLSSIQRSSDQGPFFNAVSMPGVTTTVPPDEGGREAAVAPPGPWTSQVDIPNQ
jgi:hypothetical protein